MIRMRKVGLSTISYIEAGKDAIATADRRSLQPTRTQGQWRKPVTSPAYYDLKSASR
jgi:hypothetical protein